MSELKNTFLNGLNYILTSQYSPSAVSRYAYEFYLDNDIEDKDLEYVVDYLKGMYAGPEFQLTKKRNRDFHQRKSQIKNIRPKDKK